MSPSDPVLEVGPWAEDKLARLRKYLSAFTAIMRKRHWAEGYVYVDAFAGSGQVRLRKVETDPSPAIFDLGSEFTRDPNAQELLDGSPRVALEITNPFTHYVFLERDAKRAALLRAIKEEFKGRRNIVIRTGDCNEYLSEKLVNNPVIDWRRWRGVVFLDPFGMQVPWSTLSHLAETRALEVFLNFPVGMSIQRLLKRDGQFTEKERRKLDQYFGDEGWFDVIYPRKRDLFGLERSKVEDAEQRLVAWYRERLRKKFGFVSEPHLVVNSRGGHLYFLVFAGPNPTGARIANYVLQAGKVVRQRA